MNSHGLSLIYTDTAQIPQMIISDGYHQRNLFGNLRTSARKPGDKLIGQSNKTQCNIVVVK